jgi:hypothetical protein
MLHRFVTLLAAALAGWRLLRMRSGYRRLGPLNLFLAEEALPAENEVGAPRIGG